MKADISFSTVYDAMTRAAQAKLEAELPLINRPGVTLEYRYSIAMANINTPEGAARAQRIEKTMKPGRAKVLRTRE